MTRASIAFHLAEMSLVLLLACGDSAGKRDAGRSDGAGDAVVPSGADAASVEFTVAGCKADTCGAEATICGWTSNDAKYVGCLSDCEVLGQFSGRCPEKVAALYACASLGAKVDCTTGKGTGCDAEEQALGVCLLADGGGASATADSLLGDAGVADAGLPDADGSPDALFCAPGWWCVHGECVLAPPGCQKLSCDLSSIGTYCGLIGDGCGGVLNCSPTCPQPGWICNADHQCKTPLGLCSDIACEMNGVQYCGPISDACGTIVCSTTCKQTGWECVDGRCVDPACLPPTCEWPPPPVRPPPTGEWPPAPPLPAPCVATVSP